MDLQVQQERQRARGPAVLRSRHMHRARGKKKKGSVLRTAPRPPAERAAGLPGGPSGSAKRVCVGSLPTLFTHFTPQNAAACVRPAKKILGLRLWCGC